MAEGVRVRFPLRLTVCAAGVFAVLCGLGAWQLHRLQWKEGLIAAREAAMAADPVTMTGAEEDAAPKPFTPVRLAGEYVPGKALAVGPQSWKRESGYHLLAPLRSESGRIVMVNRGWIPHAMKTAPPPAPSGAVVVEGLLRGPGPRGWLTPENDPAKGDWFTVDPKAMAAHLGLEDAAPWWVAANPGPDPARLPVGGQGAEELPNPHLQYALTWFGIAAALVAVYLVMLRRR
ncbi:MAG: SURF1 family protein [Alphaproteobacteria bacterium]|nr:SURF1 family protein [Alphaproteobacteria bacterium]